MKRLLITLVVLLFFATTSTYAQFFTIGPKFGVSSSNLKIKEAENIISGQSTVGFHAGLFTRITILGFYIQPEATFTSAGGQIKFADESGAVFNQISKLTYNKLDVPVLAGIKLGKILRINAGPSFSLILDEDARSKGTMAEVRSNYQKSTVGFQMGGGLDLGKLTLDVRYEGNLSKLGDSINFGNQVFDTDFRNSQVLFSLGLKLF